MWTHKIPQGTRFPFMSPFLGQHQNRLDAKGRVSVPAAFRSALKEISGSYEMILRPSTSYSCIEAWPRPHFNALEKSLQALDVLSEEYEDRAISLYADAYPVVADGDGRIQLPEKLAAHAGLGDSVVFMGRGNIFTIWEPAAAQARAAEARDNQKKRGAAGAAPRAKAAE
jgi:MraZ protein